MTSASRPQPTLPDPNVGIRSGLPRPTLPNPSTAIGGTLQISELLGIVVVVLGTLLILAPALAWFATWAVDPGGLLRQLANWYMGFWPPAYR
jgi:hypothetical protein